MGKKYKVMLLSITVLLVATILLGTSYSIWTTTNKQTGTNVINVGCFKITFTDTGLSENGVAGGNINLQKAYPISESDGSSLTPYIFNIKNECSIAANYSVNLETLGESNFNLDYLRIKFNDINSATNNSVIYSSITSDANPSISGSIASKNLASGYLNDGEDVTYSLRAWIDSNATTTTENVMGKVWKGKIIVNSEASPSQVSDASNYTADTPSSFKDFITPLLDESLRYKGSNANNYVKFNDELWRVIGVVDNKVKLVSVNSLSGYTADLSTLTFTKEEMQTSIDPTTNEEVQTPVSVTYFDKLSAAAQSMVEVNSTWYNGTINDLNQNANQVLVAEKLSSVTGNVGTISLSDYMFAPSDTSCVDKTVTNFNDSVNYSNCYKMNYLNRNTNMWTLTGLYAVNNNTIELGTSEDTRVIYPSVYLKDTVLVSSGNGLKNNPYILTIE